MNCSQCGADFCWLCLAPLRSHLEGHTCNRYDPVNSAQDDQERRALFYVGRHQAHNDALLFAQGQLRKIESGRKNSDVLDIYHESLLAAVKTLVTAREFLKNSYIAAWALRNDVQREIFESHQATLEHVTEQLSYRTTQNVDAVYSDRIQSHFRSIDFLTICVTKYMQRIQSLDLESSEKK
jgi:hypothetical protein